MKKIFLITLFVFTFLAFISSQSQAAGLVPCGGKGEPACQFCHFFVLFDNVIDFVLFTLVPPIAVLMLVIAGFMYIGAVFEFLPTPIHTISQAKSIITSVVLSLVIIFVAWILVNTFFMFIGVASWTGLKGGWFSINCPT